MFCSPFYYCLQAQLQSATEQLSDEQQPASQGQSEHPEFPQLQPITRSAAQNAINFFITTFLLSLYYTFCSQGDKKSAVSRT
jgi:hypothetical protein